jgi:hypothetical protein
LLTAWRARLNFSHQELIFHRVCLDYAAAGAAKK